jgi:two-component system, NarL family, invasion response regulator UvrY
VEPRDPRDRLLRQVRADYGHIPVLVVSIYPESHYGDHVMKLGASGYLCKTASPAARERRVLQAIAAGKRTGEIAAELNLSAKTVSTCRRRILDKLSLSSTADLVSYAVAHPTRAPG